MSDKETAPPPYEPAFGDPSFWPVLLSHVMGGSIRQLASAEKMIRAQVQAPQELEIEQEADGRWLAEFTRFPGVAAYGPSREEAIRNAAKVLIESEQASHDKKESK